MAFQNRQPLLVIPTMIKLRNLLTNLLPILLVLLICSSSRADEFANIIKPVLQEHCVHCHDKDDPNGKVDLESLSSTKLFRQKAAIIAKLIKVIDSNDMPPEDEDPIDEAKKAKFASALKLELEAATAAQPVERPKLRRLNRFQYNNTVKDLLQLKMDVFALSEKLMTRNSNYIQQKAKRVPDRVRVVSHSLDPKPGLRDVKPFPKDLRASHGYDNQANQLTLSPLLLDSFLKLSVSIVNSPDFNQSNVGIWKDYFEPPSEQDGKAAVAERIPRFLRIAFRQKIDDALAARYVNYAAAKLESGVPFTECMKNVTSAVLSSPMFLYRASAGNDAEKQFELASNLSYFLWASGPDEALLDLAEKGELSKPEVLQTTLKQMLADPKIERFLDMFPAQWMQLENVLSATPNPSLNRYFAIDKSRPASLQMLIEPLLLFDAVFVEDRPLIDLVAPDFAFQSKFLKTWYTSDLKPPRVDAEMVQNLNRKKDAQRAELQKSISNTQDRINAIEQPARESVLTERSENADQKPIDLKPYAAWEFDGNLKDQFGKLDLANNGKISFKNGMVELNRSYLLSKKLDFDLKEKSLEVWFMLSNLDQRGGGLMGVQGPGDFFDTIVIGERKNRHWISGSNGFSRTLDFPESYEESEPNKILHLVMVYKDGSTTLYRNGKPYGKPFKKGIATFPKNQTSIIFGLRHLPAGGNRYLNVKIDKARFYDRVLKPEEVSAAFTGQNSFVTEEQLVEKLNEEQIARRQSLQKALAKLLKKRKAIPPNQDLGRMRQLARERYDNEIRGQVRSQEFIRTKTTDARFGGVITNAAVMSMTSSPERTLPISRGAWMIEVIFNDPPPPPPNDVPPLNEEAAAKDLTIREKFAAHRENPSCAGCHSRLDPLGFALENFDITGRWRDKYSNGRDVDSSGKLMRKYEFNDVQEFKESIAREERRFAKAFTAHLLRFAVARELEPADTLTVEKIVDGTKENHYSIKSLIRKIVLSKAFAG